MIMSGTLPSSAITSISGPSIAPVQINKNNTLATSSSTGVISKGGLIITAGTTPVQQVRLVQLVLDTSNLRNGGTSSTSDTSVNASSPFTIAALSPASTSTPEPSDNSDCDPRCTICGKIFPDRQHFNAHIRMHLKEKLNTRRELKKQQEQESLRSPRGSSKMKTISTISLPSSPLPLSKIMATSAPEKPNLDALLNRLTASNCGSGSPQSKDTQASSQETMTSSIPPSPRVSTILDSPIQLAQSSSTFLMSPPNDPRSAVHSPCLSEGISSPQTSTLMTKPPSNIGIQDDLLTYEMDFQSDISSILDQLEKDFDTSDGMRLNDVRLDTPPDSDCENSDYFSQLLDDGAKNSSKLDGDEQTSKCESSKLPIIASSSKAPTKIFLASQTQMAKKIPSDASGSISSHGQPFTIINIECHQAGNAGEGLGKLIETYQAIDTGSEIKLLLGNGSPLNDVILDKATWSVRSTIGSQQQISSQPVVSKPTQTVASVSTKTGSIPKSKSSSECAVCGKSITTKNMARHMEKHTGKKKFECQVCSATFTQKMHLKNHIILHVNQVDTTPSSSKVLSKSFSCPTCRRSFVQKGHLNRHIRTAHGVPAGRVSTLSAKAAEQLTCKVCFKQCKNKVSLMRHRTKHLACVQCSAIFQNKIALQDHLLKVHPSTAIVSVERPPTQPSPIPSDDFLDPVMGGLSARSPFDNMEEDETPVGESLAEIADSNFFDSAKDITEEFYSPDFF